MKFTTKLSLVAGLAAGYVLGARAGRKRYEQIAAGAQKLWQSKPVQKQAEKVMGLVDQYVPQAVEGGFSLLGKGASALTKVATKSRQRQSAAPAPTGSADNPA
ncbi:hypothetical protein EG850_10435 [Gulosibacter macacae]|uniref:YtxH domain-containing protein n=1 Tax=Gulosibacter macacae TaxID=2488791 RepID=A0A3P3VT57_9MICO|nr:hypothetical protein [Gulosibacter macacae]RRJ85955.1 hypothetical protein EG850_10435 [Gulosibacter macacae]